MAQRRPAAPLALVFVLTVFVWATLAFASDAAQSSSADGIDRRSIRSYTVQAEEDRVDSLPGWGKLDVGLFAGYVTVDQSAGRALYYIFIEAKENAATAPVLLWLNGGPGCSSIGGGFMSELGPFFPTPGGKDLIANPHSWHHFANVIFLDSPAFVGFSYSNTSSDKFVGDARTARDAHTFLTGFFERYPQYQSNQFWITGESYAGHYVPNLAWEIVNPVTEDGKQRASPNFNLTGIMVGNAWTDTATDNEGAIDFWWSHAVISDDAARGVKATCDFSSVGPLKEATGGDQAAAPSSEVYVSAARKGSRSPRSTVGAAADGSKPVDLDCDHYCNQAFAEMGNINIYDIYADVCLADTPPSTSSSSSSAGAGMLGAGRRGVGRRQGAAARQLARMLRDAPAKSTLALKAMLGDDDAEDPPYDACVDDEVQTYLNRPEVKAALHAASVPWNWTDCSSIVQYSYLDLLSSVLSKYHRLLKIGGLKILVYSGDIDAIVPVIGSRRWVSRLGLPVVRPWRPWVSSTQQVGGYVVDYDGLTFATVRGAGHMVPYVQPERAYALISGFLSRSSGSEAGPLREFVSPAATVAARQAAAEARAAAVQHRADTQAAEAVAVLVKWWAFVVGGAALVALAAFTRKLASEQRAQQTVRVVEEEALELE